MGVKYPCFFHAQLDWLFRQNFSSFISFSSTASIYALLSFTFFCSCSTQIYKLTHETSKFTCSKYVISKSSRNSRKFQKYYKIPEFWLENSRKFQKFYKIPEFLRNSKNSWKTQKSQKDQEVLKIPRNSTSYQNMFQKIALKKWLALFGPF